MSDNQEDKVSFRERLQYKIDNFFSGGATRIIMALVPLFIVAFTLTASVRLIVNLVYPDPIDADINSIAGQLWRTLLQIMDIGGIEEEENAFYFNKTLGVLTAVVGLLLFSTMLAIFSSLFKEKLENLRKGKSAVIESDHTLILGFSNRALEIIRELVEANASEKDAAVVILANEEKEVMDDFFRYNLLERETTRIITRSGATSSHLMLEKLGVKRARSVIILNEAGPAEHDDVKAQADYRVLKSILAILAVVDGAECPPIVANLHFKRNRVLAESIMPGTIFTIDDDTILAKILVQTSRVSGLSFVYSDLVGFKGNEVYFSEIPEHLLHLTFGQILFHFMQSVPLGIRTHEGKIQLNPPADTTFVEGDELVVLAEDDSTIKYYDAPPVLPQDIVYSTLKDQVKTERFLIIGWSNKSPTLLEEYSSYIKDDSRIDIVVSRENPEIEKIFRDNKVRYPNANVNMLVSDYLSPDFPQNLSPQNYDTVVILAANGNNAEEIDAETIFLLLKFRRFFLDKSKEPGEKITTRLISEVMDSDNIEIIQQTGVRDFLISNQIVSKIMAQLAEDPAVKMIYDDLFRESGSEIYLKPAYLYVNECPRDVSFADLTQAAILRGEVCFGVRLTDFTQLEDSDTGIRIIPSKDTIFHMNPDDLLIVLAEDET